MAIYIILYFLSCIFSLYLILYLLLFPFVSPLPPSRTGSLCAAPKQDLHFYVVLRTSSCKAKPSKSFSPLYLWDSAPFCCTRHIPGLRLTPELEVQLRCADNTKSGFSPPALGSISQHASTRDRVSGRHVLGKTPTYPGQSRFEAASKISNAIGKTPTHPGRSCFEAPPKIPDTIGKTPIYPSQSHFEAPLEIPRSWTDNYRTNYSYQGSPVGSPDYAPD